MKMWKCENVKVSKSNIQSAFAKAPVDKLGIGNIGTGNISTLVTFIMTTSNLTKP